MKEELYITYKKPGTAAYITDKVELLESLRPNLTFNIADIAKPDQRKSDYSKTIKLPGSKKLNEVFEWIFEVNIDLQTFNPNLKTDVLYLVDDETALDGYLQLKQVDILDNDDVVYQCTIIGRVGDFIKALGDSELTDLDLSALNHVYNKTNQANSWTTIPTNYVYPMIDYGTHYDWSDWTIQDFFPAITAKKYIDEMFLDAGYSYSSAFFDSDFFKKLIIPCSSRDFALTGTEINNRIFNANTVEWDTSGDADFTISETPVTIYLNADSDKLVFTNEVADVGGVYDHTNGVYTVAESGYYNLNIIIELNVEFAPTGAGAEAVDVLCALTGALSLRNYNLGGGSYSLLDQTSIGITYTSAISAGGVGLTTASPTYPDDEYQTAGTANVTNVGLQGGDRYYSPPNKYVLQATNVFLTATDEVSVYGDFFLAPTAVNSTGKLFEGQSTGTFYTGEATVKLISGTFFNQVVNSGYVEGNTISMNNTIPKKIKQKDFFMSLVKMFNLYVQADTQNDTSVFIEPRDDFYDSTITDWSQKLDVSKPLEFLPMGALDSKDYLFTYKADKDYYNALYTTTWDEIYGQEKDGVTNDFIKKTYKTEIIFSPTPSKGILANDRIIPSIIKTDDDGKAQRTQSNIRILQWGGLLDTASMWKHTDSSITNKKKYPYAGHYDEPYTPTMDINFGLTKEIYYDNTFETITWNDNNLYNKYYKKFIEEITDVNSKVVKGWFYLRPGDIRSLSFRTQYYFDGAYFRLNKIENYNPDSPVTKCEFLKIKDADVFSPTTATATGGIDNMAGKPLPKFSSGSDVLKAGNSYASLEQKVLGENNYISRTATSININGDSNKVFSEANNVIIQGDSNTVEAGLSDITLINTNSVTVTSSSVTYLNGELIGEGSIITITSSTPADEGIKTYLADTTGGNVLLTLPTEPTIGKVWNVKLTEASNYCQLRTAGSETIDGAATKNITVLNTTVTVQYDGANYIII